MTDSDRARRQTQDQLDSQPDQTAAVRRFLEVIVRDDAAAAPARRPVDTERLVTRFAWTCEELNVAFGDIDAADAGTVRLLVEHGLAPTLAEIRLKAAALLHVLDGDQARDTAGS